MRRAERTRVRTTPMSGTVRRRRLRPANRAGQSLVEFALVLPILLLLILGIFEFGRAYNAYQVVTDAAREAARRTAVDDSTATVTIDSIAISALNRAGLVATDSMIAVVDPQAEGLQASVTIDLPFNFLFLGPFLGWATGQSQIVLHSRSIMRHE